LVTAWESWRCPTHRSQRYPAKIQTRKITLSELTMTIQVTDVQSLAESPAGLLSSFEDVFKAAGIVSPARRVVDRSIV
jgi:hypothetical protein